MFRCLDATIPFEKLTDFHSKKFVTMGFFFNIVQVMVEATMVRLFEQLLKYSNHAKRVTIQIADVKLSWWVAVTRIL